MSVIMLVGVKQDGIKWDVFSGQCRHLSPKLKVWHWVGVPYYPAFHH